MRQDSGMGKVVAFPTIHVSRVETMSYVSFHLLKAHYSDSKSTHLLLYIGKYHIGNCCRSKDWVPTRVNILCEGASQSFRDLNIKGT